MVPSPSIDEAQQLLLIDFACWLYHSAAAKWDINYHSVDNWTSQSLSYYLLRACQVRNLWEEHVKIPNLVLPATVK